MLSLSRQKTVKLIYVYLLNCSGQQYVVDLWRVIGLRILLI